MQSPHCWRSTMLSLPGGPPWPGCVALGWSSPSWLLSPLCCSCGHCIPSHYDYNQALKMTSFFYNAQRVGALPRRQQCAMEVKLPALYETG